MRNWYKTIQKILTNVILKCLVLSKIQRYWRNQKIFIFNKLKQWIMALIILSSVFHEEQWMNDGGILDTAVDSVRDFAVDFLKCHLPKLWAAKNSHHPPSCMRMNRNLRDRDSCRGQRGQIFVNNWVNWSFNSKQSQASLQKIGTSFSSDKEMLSHTNRRVCVCVCEYKCVLMLFSEVALFPPFAG